MSDLARLEPQHLRVLVGNDLDDDAIEIRELDARSSSLRK